ncbi:MAG: protein disulfide oxidoreductase [Azonexaceae bacterium]|nr:protein disulfide oxidoreductase [Azonexaceae bacterium]
MTETTHANPVAPRWRRWVREAAIFLVLFAAFQAWQLRNTPHGPAPQLSGLQIDGQLFDLTAWRQQHPGQALLIYFWADWCGVCKANAGNVSSINADWPLVTVAMQSGPTEKVAETLRQRGYAWPTIADPASEIFAKYGFQGVPAFVIVAPDGNISSTSIGYTSEIGLRLRLWWASQSHS